MEVGGSGRARGTSKPGDYGDDYGGHDDGDDDDGDDDSAMQKLTSSRALPYISVRC